MKRILAWIFAISLLSGSSSLRADEYSDLFQRANQAYDAGNYSAAIAGYLQIYRAGRGNWQLFYNLGNAYFRADSLGKAILFYEKALKLNPDNEDIRFNLEYANLKIVDRIPEPPKQPWVRWMEGIVLGPPFSVVLWTTLILYALFLVGFALRYFWPRLEYQRGYRFAVWSTGILFAAFLMLFSFRWMKQSTERFGVILAPEVTVTSSPTADATAVFQLHEGTRFKVEELSGKWVRIRLRDGKVGWVPREVLEFI